MRTILCKRLKFTNGCFLALKNLLYFVALFHCCLTNSKRFDARLTHNYRLNRNFVRTDGTTQDSEETATAAITRKQCKSTNQNPRERG